MDIATRQRLPKHCSAFRGDLRVAEVEIFEGGQSLEMYQTGIGDLRVGEGEEHEIGQACEILQSGVGDLCVVEGENLEASQSLFLLT